MRYPLFIFCLLPIQSVSLHAQPPAQKSQVTEVFADPASVKLEGPNSRFLLLIHGKTVDGLSVDLTRAAQYESTSPTIFQVSRHGLIGGVADGRGMLKISVVGRVLQGPVEVSQSSALKKFNFENDIHSAAGSIVV